MVGDSCLSGTVRTRFGPLDLSLGAGTEYREEEWVLEVFWNKIGVFLVGIFLSRLPLSRQQTSRLPMALLSVNQLEEEVEHKVDAENACREKNLERHLELGSVSLTRPRRSQSKKRSDEKS